MTPAPGSGTVGFKRAGHSSKWPNCSWPSGQGLNKVAVILLEFGATANTLDQWNWSALDVAEAYGFPEVAELIIDGGGINGPRITIHEAAGAGDNDMVALHLFFGTDINQLSDAGETPLDIAANAEKAGTTMISMSSGWSAPTEPAILRRC